jgi:hypothetical protein
MKSALFALGALALGASAYYYLDPKRARATSGGRHGSWRPPALGRNDASVEPGEIEEIAGTSSVSPTGRTASSEMAPGTSGISTPGAPPSGTGAYGVAAGGSGTAASGGGFSTPHQTR